MGMPHANCEVGTVECCPAIGCGTAKLAADSPSSSTVYISGWGQKQCYQSRHTHVQPVQRCFYRAALKSCMPPFLGCLTHSEVASECRNALASSAFVNAPSSANTQPSCDDEQLSAMHAKLRFSSASRAALMHCALRASTHPPTQGQVTSTPSTECGYVHAAPTAVL